ncbi:MAG: nitrate reductase molybdenum cofactor assembly chaperone [Dermatophilaceae bacterium]
MRLALRRKKAGDLPFDLATTRNAWQCASVLLAYPDETLLGHLPAVRQVCATLPARLRAPLETVAATVGSEPVEELRQRYVETFDSTRRCAPYLTYFSCGDTRKRGVALVQLKQTYRRAGAVPPEDELPDHLSVVLEFGACVDPDQGLRLLLTYRAGLEVLRLALRERESLWANVLDAVCATLPTLEGDEESAVARLVEQGPPAEDVGLDAYPIDPRLNPAGRLFEPLPATRGARS